MRTAIVSGLHLRAASGEDVLRDPAMWGLLLEEIGGADRVVLLGDVVEWRDWAPGVALDSARPFFEELGAALGEREVTIVPGNHDYRLAEPLLDRLSLKGAGSLGLEHHDDAPGDGAGAVIDSWLGPASLRISYPGLWLRDDVYVTHGHYMAAPLSLPRAECLAVATLIRLSGQLPDPAGPADYERVLRPIYGFSFGVAQARGRTGRPPPPPPLRSRLEGARRQRQRRRRRQAAARGLGPQGLPGGNLGDQPPARLRVRGRHLGRGDLRRRGRGGDRDGGSPGSRRPPRDHRPQPPRRPQPGRGELAPARRRPAAQHRQLGLRLGLPQSRQPAQLLLARHRHLARGRRPAAPRAAAPRPLPRRDARGAQPNGRSEKPGVGVVGASPLLLSRPPPPAFS